MKLTTLKTDSEQRNNGINNIFKLKKLIQQAANNSNSQQSKQILIKSVNNNSSKLKQKGDIKIENNLNKYKSGKNRLNSSHHFTNSITVFSTSKSIKNNKHHENKQNICHLGNRFNKSSMEVFKNRGKVSCTNLVCQNLNSYELGKLKKKMKKSEKQRTIKIIDAPIMSQIPQKLKKCQSSHELFQRKFRNMKNNAEIITSKPKKNDFARLNCQMFTIGRKLGKGRFGYVFSAEDKRTGLLVALKIINKKQLKQFQMEEQLTSQIKLQLFMKHPNVLQMYGFFDDQINIYLILQLGEQCLFKKLRSKLLFTKEEQAASYTRQVIEGLKYLHSQLIIHRDLKPENLLLVNDVVKIADFGWSVYSPVYKRQTFCGTLDYVSPEIVKGQYYDESVDIWSLGILIYELAVGKAPFEGSKNQQEVFNKIMNSDFSIPERLSDQFSKLIRCILDKDPVNRITLNDIVKSQWMKQNENGNKKQINSDIWGFWQKS